LKYINPFINHDGPAPYYLYSFGFCMYKTRLIFPIIDD